jgi:hypothetical protein
MIRTLRQTILVSLALYAPLLQARPPEPILGADVGQIQSLRVQVSALNLLNGLYLNHQQLTVLCEALRELDGLRSERLGRGRALTADLIEEVN